MSEQASTAEDDHVAARLAHDVISRWADTRAPESARADHAALIALLLGGRTTDDPITEPLASAVASACMAPEHLWRSLELPDRASLRLLLETYFRPLAQANTTDMRWKRYFYKRLCGWEGHHH